MALEFHERGSFTGSEEQSDIETDSRALGCHVIATARNPVVLDQLGEMGMSVVSLDVTNKESIAACKAQVEIIAKGKLDILVNNA